MWERRKGYDGAKRESLKEGGKKGRVRGNGFMDGARATRAITRRGNHIMIHREQTWERRKGYDVLY